MIFLDKINKILSFNLEDKYDAGIVKKIQLLNIFMFVGTITMLVFLVIGIITNEQKIVLTNVISLLIIIGSWIYFYKTKNYRPAINIVSILYTILLIGYLTTGGHERTGLLWFYPFPFFMTHFFDSKKGVIFSLISLFIVLFVFFLPIDIFVEYKMSFKLRFLGSYSFLVVAIFFVERISLKMRKKLEKKCLTHNRLATKKMKL